MYHHIGKSEDESCGSFFVSDELFARQIDLLLAEGYHPVSLSEVEDSYISKKKLPERSVLLTFDDGYLNNYTYAYPMILEKKIPITIFLTTGEIGTKDGMLSWDQVQEMYRSSLVDFSSHGVNHQRLRRLGDQEALSELTVSKTQMEGQLKKTVRSFCYPYGSFDQRTRKLVFQAGYLMDFGTRKGVNHWPWKGNRPLLRAHVMRTDQLKHFRNQLATGYKNGPATWIFR
jgi:peptidoglycan/xylan/chitin deacetylase (PgdA/CDA1 family)